MKKIRFAIIAASFLASTAAFAADAQADAARQDRMDSALQTYRDSASKNPNPGPFARAEESTKRGVRKAGSAVKRGAKKTANAVENAGVKTKAALRRTGEKLQDVTGTAPK